LVVLAALLVVPAALADDPHIVNAKATIDSHGNLNCSFRKVGFSTRYPMSALMSCFAYAVVTYTCVWDTTDPNDPSTWNYNTYSTYTSADGYGDPYGQTPWGSEGTLIYSIAIPLIQQANRLLNFDPCPEHQVLVLSSVTYSSVGIVDSGNGGKSAYSIPGTFTRTF
jgi:hypothetical protein